MDLNEIETNRNTGRQFGGSRSSSHKSPSRGRDQQVGFHRLVGGGNHEEATNVVGVDSNPDVENLKKIQEDLISKLKQTECLISSLSSKQMS